MNIISIVSIIIYIICAVLLGLGIFFGIKKTFSQKLFQLPLMQAQLFCHYFCQL